ncbi:MAG TPA: hypothetical protein VM537_21105 [Anaerolineae bacterium]|nr:hypothetical protein [Anaerolineae bacterium]
MTKQEAIDYLTTIEPQPVDMVTLDAVVWADFKASMLVILEAPEVDPTEVARLKALLEAVNVEVDQANAMLTAEGLE